MTYTEYEADGESCYECGLPASIVLVADAPDKETGHVDERAYCDVCNPNQTEWRE